LKKYGKEMHALDISEEMIKITKAKNPDRQIQGWGQFQDRHAVSQGEVRCRGFASTRFLFSGQAQRPEIDQQRF